MTKFNSAFTISLMACVISGAFVAVVATFSAVLGWSGLVSGEQASGLAFLAA